MQLTEPAASRVVSQISIVKYCAVIQSSWRAKLFIHHIKYDETPIRVIGTYRNSEPALELRKVFVVHSSWLIMLQRAKEEAEEACNEDDILVLRGSASPECRFAANSTGNTISSLLSTCWHPGPEVDFFEEKWRISETDANNANLKSERLQHEQLKAQGWQSLPGVCAAHRLHSIATKCWTHSGPTQSVLTGCVRSLLVLQSPGALIRFQQYFVKEAIEALVVIPGAPALSPDALAFREKALLLFCPSGQRASAKATVQELSQCLFNGDWRSCEVQHYCPQHCCESLRETKAAVARWVPKLLSALRVIKMSRASWSTWHESLNLLGLLSCTHFLFKRVFLLAFGNSLDTMSWDTVQEGEDKNPEELDEVTAWRAEMSKNLRISLNYWKGEEPQWRLFFLRAVLHPQTVAMAYCMKVTSHTWEQEQQLLLHQRGLQTMLMWAGSSKRPKKTNPLISAAFSNTASQGFPKTVYTTLAMLS